MWSATILLLTFVSFSTSQFTQDYIEVNIKNGAIKGRTLITEELKKTTYSFRGIPYAKPPVDELRFELPVPIDNWDHVLDATEDREQCVQNWPIEGSEDCLFINVYTPVNPTKTCDALPVMVWVYGGGFEGGNSSYENHGPDYFLDQDIVIVTFNYRLSILGFLSTGDSVVPGNNGLRDQQLAMKWVQNNIGSFCGDPKKVTLAGQSAGSVSVSYHLQIPSSAPLFQAAILQSGTSLCLWGLSRRVLPAAKIIAEALGIDSSTTRSIVDGLKRVNITYLQEISSQEVGSLTLQYTPREGFIFGPVKEHDHPDAIFTADSYEILKKGQFSKVPLLLGYNSMEAAYELTAIFRIYLFQYDADNAKLLPVDLNINDTDRAEAAKVLKRYFFGYLPVSLSSGQLLKFLSQDQFSRGINEFAQLVQGFTPTYLYRFTYEGGLWGFYERQMSGVTHSEELGYLWRSPFEPLTPHDFVVRSRMIAMWSNFIKEGNPTPVRTMALGSTIWERADGNLTHVNIGKEILLERQPESDDMVFWEQFFAQYGNPPYNTF